MIDCLIDCSCNCIDCMNFYSCDSPLKLDEVIRDYWELEREFGGMEDED